MPSSDIAVSVRGLSKSYTIAHNAAKHTTAAEALAHRLKHPFQKPDKETFWALKDVDFEIKKGDVVGIIGRNGAGKSTLLKILSRITEPTTGQIDLHGRVGSLLEVGTGFHPELTGRENIYLNGAILGMSKREIAKQFDEIVDFSGTEQFIDTPVKRYSSGMYVRLAFAVAAHLNPEILIVDEVLAVGDAEFQKKCLGKMQDVANRGRTVLFVSHNMAAVSHLCSHAILIKTGRIALYGEVQDAVSQYNREGAQQNCGDAQYPHIIYSAPENADKYDFAVTKIEILDDTCAPKPVVETWDKIVFRVSYHCKLAMDYGSVFFDISTTEGVVLMLSSTQPDCTLPLNLEVGYGSVEYVIEGLPLAAGRYWVGAGLAVPGIEYLWRRSELAALTVSPKNVYNSGLAPSAPRSLIATPHYWRYDCNQSI